MDRSLAATVHPFFSHAKKIMDSTSYIRPNGKLNNSNFIHWIAYDHYQDRVIGTGKTRKQALDEAAKCCRPETWFDLYRSTPIAAAILKAVDLLDREMLIVDTFNKQISLTSDGVNFARPFVA